MTNFERITSSPEALAHWLEADNIVHCSNCFVGEKCTSDLIGECVVLFLQWLNAPSEPQTEATL